MLGKVEVDHLLALRDRHYYYVYSGHSQIVMSRLHSRTDLSSLNLANTGHRWIYRQHWTVRILDDSSARIAEAWMVHLRVKVVADLEAKPEN